MTLKEILEFRRATRKYTGEALDTEKVRECLRLATLAPTSSNLQLYEMYHITDKELLKKVAVACLGQQTATTAQQMVVFVTRQDLHRQRAKAIMAFETENIRRNSPPEKQEKRIKDKEIYYNGVMPFLYSRLFGIFGAFRKLKALSKGLFNPILRQVSESEMNAVVHKSCGLVAQTFMLAMAEQKYDTCPLEGFDSLRLKRLLELPCSSQINMVITCGIRSDLGIKGERFRVPFETVYREL